MSPTPWLNCKFLIGCRRWCGWRLAGGASPWRKFGSVVSPAAMRRIGIDSGPRGLRTFAIAVILACVVGATFGSVCLNEFAGFDDHITLWGNPRLHPPPPQSGMSSALWYWNHAEYALYIPVTYQVWALLTPFAQLDTPGPGGVDLSAGIFHAANLVFHSLTVVVVFLLLRVLVRRDWAAAIGALLYGLHPLQVESVAWASGLKDVLSGLGGHAGLVAILPCSSRRASRLSRRGDSSMPVGSIMPWPSSFSCWPCSANRRRWLRR